MRWILSTALISSKTFLWVYDVVSRIAALCSWEGVIALHLSQYLRYQALRWWFHLMSSAHQLDVERWHELHVRLFLAEAQECLVMKLRQSKPAFGPPVRQADLRQQLHKSAIVI